MAYYRQTAREFRSMNHEHDYSSRRSELAPKLKRNRSRHRHGRQSESSSGGDNEGPSLITMLFVAVALATIFNLSKTSYNDPATVHFKGQVLRGGMNEEQYIRYQAQQQMNGGYNGAAPLMNGSPQYATVYNPAAGQQPAEGHGPWVAAPVIAQGIAQNQNFNQMNQQNQFVAQPMKMNDMIQGADNIGITGAPDVAQSPVLADEPNQEVVATPDAPADEAPQAVAATPPVPPQPIELSASYSEVVGGGTVPNPLLAGYKDNWDPIENGDQPVFWHIPKAGGSTVKDIMGTCHRFTMASEYGIVEGHDNDPVIAVVRPGGAPVDQDPSPFINVDPTTIHGIAHAKELGLAESNLADCSVTPYIQESDTLFSPGHQGRFFTVFRHPVDRAVSMFWYIQIADWEPTYNPELAKMTIEEYAQSPMIENNWMVRQLTSSFEGDLTDDHLAVAMDIVRRKFMVGLLHEKERTMDRFEKFFGWKYRVNPENQEKCRVNLLTSGANSNSANKKVKPKPGDEAYDLVAWQNTYDIALYEFIEQLFEEQEEFVAHVPDGFRLMDASCAKCVPPTFPLTTEQHMAALATGETPQLPQPPPAQPAEPAAVQTPVAAADPQPPPVAASPGGPVVAPVLNGYKNVDEPYEFTDVPVFWHIPKAGGSTVKDIMGTCHRFTMASEYGIVEGHDNDPVIAVVRPGGAPVDQDPSPFINVDPTTIHGIAHAKELGLAESGLADCAVTPYIQESDTLFSPGHQGRFFTVFRHPVDRAVSMFWYIQIADWEPTYNPELAKMTIEEYAQSPMIENNWMVRQLTSSFEGDLTDEHLAIAKDIIANKFMVGLLHEKERTMDRFEKFFRWKYRVNPENQEICRVNLLTSGANSNSANKKVKPKPGDEAYDLVAWQNTYDIALYEFIEQLFEEQEALVSNVPDGYRLMDASCAKCVPPSFPDLSKNTA